MDGAALHGLTSPLIVRADGKKFGKSTGGAIWLAADETSPYAFYQYWMQIPDDDVESMLLRLTFLSILDISAIITVHRKEPHRRQGQRALAHHLTAIVHGDSGQVCCYCQRSDLWGPARRVSIVPASGCWPTRSASPVSATKNFRTALTLPSSSYVRDWRDQGRGAQERHMIPCERLSG